MGPLGISVLSLGQGSINADIIFIHGLRGDSVATWSKDGVYWPKDLLPKDLPNARIISWGYDATVARKFHHASQASIFGQAENLLTDLRDLRVGTGAESRALIFVCHSLGGLLLKEALDRSSSLIKSPIHKELGTIYTCTKGIVFMGTPHRGSPKSSLANVVTKIYKLRMTSPNEQILDFLESDSQVLERQRKSFAQISYRMPIACIYEELKTHIGLIVPRDSAVMDGSWVTESSIPADHMAMCRFTSRDVGYNRVLGHIKAFIRQTSDNAGIGMERLLEDLLESLAFPEMDDREEQIDMVYARTFQWLVYSGNDKVILYPDVNSSQQVARDNFLNWLHDPQHRMFWVRGKAGSGKSTLMKDLFKNPIFRAHMSSWSKEHEITYLGFFFFDRGKSLLQKSRSGLLRSLLHQILRQHEELGPMVYELRTKLREKAAGARISFRQKDWSWKELKYIFQSLIKNHTTSMRFCIFIDGLDEYSSEESQESTCEDEEDEVSEALRRKQAGHTEIARFFAEIAACPNVKLVVSSRPLLRFDKGLQGYPLLNLEDLTKPDIHLYVHGRLKHDPEMQDLMLEDPVGVSKIMNNIVNKAEGVFLWVRLVVDLLIEELAEQATVHELLEILKSLPKELGGRRGLYMRMLEDIRLQHRCQGARIFQIIQTVREPLSTSALASMEDSWTDHIEDKSTEGWHSVRILPRGMRDRIKSRCGGLLESRPATYNNKGWYGTIRPDIKKPVLYAITGDYKAISYSASDDKVPPTRTRSLIRGGEPKFATSESYDTVQFLHQTAKEFMEKDFVWQTFFPDNPRDSPDPAITLLRASIKRLRYANKRDLNHIWLIITDAIYYASLVEKHESAIEEVVFLLDELNVTGKDVIVYSTEQRPQPLLFPWHWVMTDPGYDMSYELLACEEPFLAFAVQKNLCEYVRAKLSLRVGTSFFENWGGRPLLAAAVVPTPPGKYGHSQADPRMVTVLLDQGMDPNEDFTDTIDPVSGTIWEKALLRGDTSESRGFGVVHTEQNSAEESLEDQNRWVKNIELLIQYGADPNLKIKTYTVRSPLYVISLALKYRHVDRARLQILLRKKGAVFLAGEEEELIKKGVRMSMEGRVGARTTLNGGAVTDTAMGPSSSIRDIRRSSFANSNALSLYAQIQYHLDRLERLQRQANSFSTTEKEDIGPAGDAQEFPSMRYNHV